MAIFFLSAQNPRPIYEISITSGFYITVLCTPEDKYAMNEGWRSEELIIYYVNMIISLKIRNSYNDAILVIQKLQRIWMLI